MARDTIIPLSGDRAALKDCQNTNSDPPCYQDPSGSPQRNLEPTVLAEDPIVKQHD